MFPLGGNPVRTRSLIDTAYRAGGHDRLAARLADGRVSRVDLERAQQLASAAHARTDGKLCASGSDKAKTQAADQLVNDIGAKIGRQNPIATIYETRKDRLMPVPWTSPHARAACYMGGIASLGCFRRPAWCC